MRLVAGSTKDYGIVTFAPSGSITTWNRGAERLFGYSEAEAVGQPASLMFTPDDAAGGALEHEMTQALAGSPYEQERWLLCKDGSRVYCSSVTTPMIVDGQLRGFGRISRDMDAGRRGEDSLPGREFLTALSQELKNPLNLIQLSAELLLRSPQTRELPTALRAAETIRRTVLNQSQLIDELLDLSRLRSGKLPMQLGLVDWCATVRSVIQVLQEDADGHGIALHVRLPDMPMMLQGDPVRLEQLVWNLLSNALKFTPEGGCVDVVVSEEFGQARLEVHDTGRGIDTQQLEHLFDVSDIVAAIAQRRFGLSMGVGLAVVRELVRVHGGRVEAHSEGEGQGASFTVWLPLAGMRRGVPAEAASSVLQGRRVLIVDADTQALKTLGALLELEGAVVATAGTAAAAVAAASAKPPDFVLTELSLPDASGQELLQQLQNLPAMHGLPVIAIGGLSPFMAPRDAQTGFAAVLGKPLALDSLMKVLQTTLSPSGAS
jgi:two-component system CheB/CheR fusion protein